jgi:hypothetical protein
MIVIRITHTVKPGSSRAVVALLKEHRDHQATQEQRARIYTTNLGPSHTVIYEAEYETLAAWEKAVAEWPSHPLAATFWKQMNELLDSQGSWEVWNLE